MIFLNVLYIAVIYPLVKVIELIYLFSYRLCDNFSLAVVGVSIAVSTMLLPLYFFAERLQNIEREIQTKLAPKIKKIKAVFSGDEQYMMLQAYYRENHYHPIYALRSTFGLLIQIPFFIAAYVFLSHLDALQGAHFMFIADMSKPDALFTVGGISINMLPIAMTLINITAGFVYTTGFPIRDKVQLYGMAAVFLLMLYNSPAGLVLYWTCNNIYSLIKNILQKTQYAKSIIWITLSCAAILAAVYLILFKEGALFKRILVAILCCIVPLLPAISKILKRIILKIKSVVNKNNSLAFPKNQYLFYFSAGVLFILCGITIPASLINSSVPEFSFVESFTSPFPFIFNTVFQAAGFFLFWPICLYSMAPQKIKQCCNMIAPSIAVCAVVNTFLFYRDYGWLTPALIFSNPAASGIRIPSDQILYICNAAVLIVIFTAAVFFDIAKKYCCALFVAGCVVRFAF
ncbi:MAG: hypothetical protein Ta2F_05870 [Termitinemataceae bacterium]|nr:MAG: hypothetical protein Ta2F_05870 [Termitinemataceae bacterium]